MRIVDLTGSISEKMWDYGDPFSPFSRRQISDLNSRGYFAYEYRLFSHMGTHLDSLAHLELNAPGVDQISLETLHGIAIVIPINNCNALHEINLSDIKQYRDEIKENDIVLICTGWDRMWEDRDYASQTPYLSNELAEWFIEKRIKLVGTDTALCCDPRQGLTYISKDANITDSILLKNNIPFINGLVNLTQFEGKRIHFLALPLKIQSSEGTQVRAVALIDD